MSAYAHAKRIVRYVLSSRVKARSAFLHLIENSAGLEIGGPSHVFSDFGILPLYRHIRSLDNCVFSVQTLWEGSRSEGQTFVYHPKKPTGFNFIRESTNLDGLQDDTYDFILASHTLEHSANPIKALKEFQRVAKPRAPIIAILPHFRYTFDHHRKLTTVNHMLDNYERNIPETDETHIEEILELHDLSRDRPAGTGEQFRARSARNLENRCLHHHVFDEHNSRELFEAAGLDVEILEFVKPHHIVLRGHSRAHL
jgi:SAM-dependent methyltransferase